MILVNIYGPISNMGKREVWNKIETFIKGFMRDYLLGR